MITSRGIYPISLLTLTLWELYGRASDCSLRWRHNDHAGVSNHQPHGCLLNRLFRRKSKKTSKLRVTGLCAGNSPGTGEFPAQMASYAENVSIWWRHHVWASSICHGLKGGSIGIVVLEINTIMCHNSENGLFMSSHSCHRWCQHDWT